MAHLARQAAMTESEGEAEAFIGALVPLAAKIIPRAARLIARNAPTLVRTARRITRNLRRDPTTRRLVQAMPVVLQRTAQSLADQAADRPADQRRHRHPHLEHHDGSCPARPAGRSCGAGRSTSSTVAGTVALGGPIAARLTASRDGYGGSYSRRFPPVRPATCLRQVGQCRSSLNWTERPKPKVVEALVAAPPRARILSSFATGQAVNVRRHFTALRDFNRGSSAPRSPGRPRDTSRPSTNCSPNCGGHSRRRCATSSWRARPAGRAGADDRDLARLLTVKSRAHDWVRATERVWDFYFELFGQRQGAYGEWLFSCDRIALDCYRHVFMHIGSSISIPSPPPFAYMRTGFSPATYRRNIPLRKLGRQLNPFPLVQLPYHRLVNPWTMGAIMHEVSHNLQNELELQRVVPASIMRSVRAVGAPAGGGADVGAVEPRDLRRHGRLHARR